MAIWEGYHPEIGFTKYIGGTDVLYFDHDGKYLGTGSLHDLIAFKWIKHESYRKHPEQIVDEARTCKMICDGYPMYLKFD